jgi:hypothetical protein
MRCGTLDRITLLLALALALGLGGAGAVTPGTAQGGAPAGSTFHYTDAQGPGCLTIASLGDDPQTGGLALAVTLRQPGATLAGQGEEWLVSLSAPLTTAFTFWLSDGPGDSLVFFVGELRMGVDTQTAQGHWTSLQDPTVTDQWQAVALVPQRPCTGS